MFLVTFTKPAKKRRELETKMMKEKLFVFLKQSRCQVCVSKIPEIKDQKTKPFLLLWNLVGHLIPFILCINYIPGWWSSLITLSIWNSHQFFGRKACVFKIWNFTLYVIACLSLLWSNGWEALSFLVRLSRPILTHYHFYWPSSIIYQPVPLHTDPAPPSSIQYHLLLTQYHLIPSATAP